MNKLSLLLVCLMALPTLAFGKEIECLPRSEIGETTTGQHFFERDEVVKPSNKSRIDFEKLTVTGVSGTTIKIEKVEKNLYKTTGVGVPYYYHTDDSRSIVTESQVKDSAAYIKVLLCK